MERTDPSLHAEGRTDAGLVAGAACAFVGPSARPASSPELLRPSLPQAVLMTGVFVALILGAFVQGISPTIASVRGNVLEYVLAISYNR